MSEVIDRFCAEHHDYNDISPKRRVMQRRVLLEFEASAGVPILEAGPDALRDFLSARLEGGLAPSTVQKELRAITPLFTWARERKLIDRDALLDIREVKGPRGANGGQPRPYSRKELQKLWVDLDARYPLAPQSVERWHRGQATYRRVRIHAVRLQVEAIIACALYGGMRAREIYGLNLEDLHPDNDVIVVRSARKNRDNEERLRGVPMFSPLREAIANWLEFRGWMEPDHERPWLRLWYTQTAAEPMPAKSFDECVGHIRRKQDGKGVWELHRFRHTAATEMLRAPMPIQSVQKILGHSRIEQTLAYAKIINEDLIAAAQKVDANFAEAIRPKR